MREVQQAVWPHVILAPARWFSMHRPKRLCVMVGYAARAAPAIAEGPDAIQELCSCPVTRLYVTTRPRLLRE
ncbi:MAG: hypothetical protein JWO80_4052 [Bryobacterales bacterium]|nr:hypothetical protein [Bryobacterales bacterium]